MPQTCHIAWAGQGPDTLWVDDVPSSALRTLSTTRRGPRRRRPGRPAWGRPVRYKSPSYAFSVAFHMKGSSPSHAIGT